MMSESNPVICSMIRVIADMIVMKQKISKKKRKRETKFKILIFKNCKVLYDYIILW